MRWIELEIVVPAPPAEAFAWVVEPGLLKEWLPQLEELRPRGFLHHRPVVRHGGLRLGLDVRVSRVVVPEVLELDVAWRGVAGRTTLEVDPHDDGATVTWRVGLTLPPTLRLAGPGVARELRRIMRRDLELLAERLGEPHPDVDEHEDGEVDVLGPDEPLPEALEEPGQV
ncbi:SRPBCC family protein [Patulibacter minatonensis]|uniref:SRPBCC family protein n=1 Tax=Patulibacter minatonensis TaxID=298163 RepID=UPI00047EF265|nr:SRPBCC family protein [Patulibacter minatonensis]